MSVYLKWLNETGLNELELVGGKNASLGEMLRNLSILDINVPFGFIITSHAYDYFMNTNNLRTFHINKNLLNNKDINDIKSKIPINFLDKEPLIFEDDIFVGSYFEMYNQLKYI